MSGLLRICTAGSVDDGKSTLIGRLLYDSRAVYEDQVASVEKASKNRVAGPIDFSLFTDGLKAEREQGITIDVAYRYFATARRKFILADTPGHEQYTRNMATGASTADVAVLLVDARNGVRTQSRRHARIARLLGINDFVLAINKMDLVDFDRGVFDGIVDDFEEILRGSNYHPIPLSALHGDNVTTNSDKTPWFDGKPLLNFLETVEVDRNATGKPFRMPVQLVSRPDDTFRGYAGPDRVGHHQARRHGDGAAVRPQQQGQAHRHLGRRPRDGARADVGDADARGRNRHLAAATCSSADSQPAALSYQPSVEKRFEAEMVWMDERPLDPARVYLLKQGTRVVSAEVSRGLILNQIGTVTVTTARPLVFDRYTDNRFTGSFILIDPATNFTAGAGMITAAVHERTASHARPSAAERLAQIARSAATEAEAVELVRLALEDILK